MSGQQGCRDEILAKKEKQGKGIADHLMHMGYWFSFDSSLYILLASGLISASLTSIPPTLRKSQKASSSSVAPVSWAKS